jgi:hypothetical protein
MEARPLAIRSNNQRSPAAIIFRALVALGLLVTIGLQTSPALNQEPDSGTRPSLTPAEEQLRRESRKAIIDTGFSEQYFDQHFQLVRVFNQPGDRRVVWKFSINQYEALLNDAIGYYSSALGERVNTHSITTTLQSSHDIEKTITRKRADQILRHCIGRYSGDAVMLGVQSSTGRSGLYMIASSRSRREPENQETGEKRRSSKNESTNTSRAQQTDVVPREGGDGDKPLVYAVLDLETGKCVKAEALVAP